MLLCLHPCIHQHSCHGSWNIYMNVNLTDTLHVLIVFNASGMYYLDYTQIQSQVVIWSFFLSWMIFQTDWNPTEKLFINILLLSIKTPIICMSNWTENVVELRISCYKFTIVLIQFVVKVGSSSTYTIYLFCH